MARKNEMLQDIPVKKRNTDSSMNYYISRVGGIKLKSGNSSQQKTKHKINFNFEGYLELKRFVRR